VVTGLSPRLRNLKVAATGLRLWVAVAGDWARRGIRTGQSFFAVTRSEDLGYNGPMGHWLATDGDPSGGTDGASSSRFLRKCPQSSGSSGRRVADRDGRVARSTHRHGVSGRRITPAGRSFRRGRAICSRDF
jgi:hypothetical protein